MCPVGGYLPSCCPTTLDYLGPLWFFCFLNDTTQRGGRPLQPPKPCVLWPPPHSCLLRWRTQPWYVTAGAAGLQAPEPQWGSTCSMGRLCYLPASSQQMRQRPAGRKGLPAQHTPCLVTRQPPFPIYKHSLGLFLNTCRYEVFS